MSTPTGPRQITAEDVARAADRVHIARAIEIARAHNWITLAWLLKRFLGQL